MLYKFSLVLSWLFVGLIPAAFAEEFPQIVKGAAGKGEAVVSHPPARRGDPSKAEYFFQFAITGREDNLFTAVIAEPAGRGRPAMEAKIKGELIGKNQVVFEIVGMERGTWFPYIPKKMEGKIENNKMLLQWARNDRQPVETKGALEVILTEKK